MGIGGSRSGTRSAQLDQKEETIILRLCDEIIRRLSGERDHAGHCTGSEKGRETKVAMDWQHGKMS